jgi:hypothetical protein
MMARRKWDVALCALVQDDNGKPLAKLLRKGRCMLHDGVWVPQIPLDVAFALAELFDPHSPTSPFVKRSKSAEAERLKAGIEVEEALKALMVECDRLVKTYNAQVNRLKALSSKRRSICGKDMITLKQFAEEHDDQKALRAFADHTKAQNRFTAAMNAINPAVRLTIKPLSTERRERLQRNGGIIGAMLAATLLEEQSVSDAAEDVGKKVGLTDRQVLRIVGHRN